MDEKERNKKIEVIASHFKGIMEELGLFVGGSMLETPKRVAKMYVDELCSGLTTNYKAIPTEFTIEGDPCNEIIVRDIAVNSLCEHHFVPIIGRCHIGVRPYNKYLGLSKFNRIVEAYSRQPQIQENLTVQIGNHMKRIFETSDICVVIDAVHLCVRLRGVKDQFSVTRTVFRDGDYAHPDKYREFLSSIPTPKVSDLFS